MTRIYRHIIQLKKRPSNSKTKEWRSYRYLYNSIDAYKTAAKQTVNPGLKYNQCC